MNKNKYITASLILIAIALFSRIIPHAPNFTPLVSIALVSALLFKEKKYIFISLLGLLFSDILLDYYHYSGYLFTPLFFLTYISLGLVFLFSYKFSNSLSFKSIVFHSFSGALIFFLASNFSVWLLGGYTYTFTGLISCYTMGIPFFKNTLSSTLLYSIVLCMPALYKKYSTSLKEVHS